MEEHTTETVRFRARDFTFDLSSKYEGISIRARAIFSPVECLYKSFIPEAWLSNKGESAARTTSEVFDCDHLRTQTMSFTNCLRKRLRRIQQSLFSPVETRAWDIGFNGIDCITSARQLLFPLPSSPGCNPAARIVTKVTILLELDRAMTSRIRNTYVARHKRPGCAHGRSVYLARFFANPHLA